MEKKEEQKEERTHRSSVGRERIAHDIGIMGHNMLPSNAICSIGINRPRDMWRIYELTSNRRPITIPHISSHDKPREKKEMKNKSLNIYLNSE